MNYHFFRKKQAFVFSVATAQKIIVYFFYKMCYTMCRCAGWAAPGTQRKGRAGMRSVLHKPTKMRAFSSESAIQGRKRGRRLLGCCGEKAEKAA
jgi:hypothetical protein